MNINVSNWLKIILNLNLSEVQASDRILGIFFEIYLFILQVDVLVKYMYFFTQNLTTLCI